MPAGEKKGLAHGGQGRHLGRPEEIASLRIASVTSSPPA